MRLSRLEISGFKSFSKSVILEFPELISAIVGPNGSGKSNVADAIRWVMGEQSMKSLRGKRGEDLIFNGSDKASKLGKGSVTLVFDNADGKIPLDFPEVRIGRTIFRDGTNEYFLNDSNVRLRDIVELMARMGLGENKHNIIGQGEVDRWLLSSSRDRKDILEEALGLKVYQLKKEEAERKLRATAENMKEAESLLREITPHIKFLKNQADKAEARETFEVDLKRFERLYFASRFAEIEKEEEAIAKDASPIEKELEIAEEKVKALEIEIRDKERTHVKPDDLAVLEKKLQELEDKHRISEREFGRLEGRLVVEREKSLRPIIRITDATYIKGKIRALLDVIKSASGDLKEAMRKIRESLEALSGDLERGTVEEKQDEEAIEALAKLEKDAKEREQVLTSASQGVDKARTELREAESRWRVSEADLRKLERELRTAEEERAKIRTQLERATFEREKLIGRRKEVEEEMRLLQVKKEDLSGISKADLESGVSSQDLFKRIERLRGKLEEIGGIDISVVKEYQETKDRFEFLTKELTDLRQADASLKELIETLEKQIEEDFDRGFKKINESFNHYFQIIFGGGKAKLSYQELGKRKTDEDEEAIENEEEETEYGIDIDVDIPRKRIKSLSMLSGGERALTSIALLFAMVAVNPPPFLILDETDAALDEANSQKYANTLADLSLKTQLIIITHNRETMLRAGVLYGVTMGDDGVSKLLSIKFEEGEKYVNR